MIQKDKSAFGRQNSRNYLIRTKRKNNFKKLRGALEMKTSSVRIIYIIGALGEEKGAENLFEEIMAKNLPNPGKETDIQVLESKKVPNKMNPKRPTPRHNN